MGEWEGGKVKAGGGREWRGGLVDSMQIPSGSAVLSERPLQFRFRFRISGWGEKLAASEPSEPVPGRLCGWRPALPASSACQTTEGGLA